MKKVIEIIEQKPIQVILGLLMFHLAMATLMSWVAYSPYLSALHNGQGLWNFSGDSFIYHREAVTLIEVLNAANWKDWWSSFPGHFHVKWLGLLYWLYGDAEPFLFELVNSVVWVTSVVLIYLAARMLFNKNTTVATLATLFLFYPTVILSSTQLLREPIYILGLCFITYGWVSISQESSTWKGACSIVIGFTIVTVVRSYLIPMLLWVFIPASVILIFRKKFTRYPALLMTLAILMIAFGGDFTRVPPIEGGGFSAATTRGVENLVIVKMDNHVIDDSTGKVLGILESSILDEKTGKIIYRARRNILDKDGKIIGYVIPIALSKAGDVAAAFLPKKKKTQVFTGADGKIYTIKINAKGQVVYVTKEKKKEYWFDKVAWRLDAMRYGFRNINVNAGSNIDAYVRYKDIGDMLAYLPRAIQVSFLSPFPSLWVSSGNETGRIGRILSGFETVILYIVLIGFLYALFKGIRILEPLLPVLIFSGVVIILLGFVVPNVGAIYRMRQGLLIPFFMVGVYGLYLFFNQMKYKSSEK